MEDLRVHDFYSNMPSPMNGYQMDCNVLERLTFERFPELNRPPTDGMIQTVLGMLTPKFFISLFLYQPFR